MCENAHNLCAIAHNPHSKHNVYQYKSTNWLYGTLFVYITLRLRQFSKAFEQTRTSCYTPFQKADSVCPVVYKY